MGGIHIGNIYAGIVGSCLTVIAEAAPVDSASAQALHAYRQNMMSGIEMQPLGFTRTADEIVPADVLRPLTRVRKFNNQLSIRRHLVKIFGSPTTTAGAKFNGSSQGRCRHYYTI
jgi:hypothetical protein